MKSHAKLIFGIAVDILAGLALGVIGIVLVLMAGVLVTVVCALLGIALVAVCLIGWPLLALFVGVCLLVGYPVSTGRTIKLKIKEHVAEIKRRRGNLATSDTFEQN
jgi:hypothetical protein